MGPAAGRVQPDMILAKLPAAQPVDADWRRHWREAVTDPHHLLALLDLDHLAARVPALPPHGFALRVPLGFVARMRRGDADDPLLRQVLPLDAELDDVAGYGTDAVGDLAARSAHGVLQKYHGRALLIATGACAVHCRYCFRRHFPYAEETASTARWRPALQAIGADPSINEVILSGGDPLSLSTQRLAEFSSGLRDFTHVGRLRIHTRLPVVLPERVDAELSQWLGSVPLQKVVVIHANHAREIDSGVAAAMSVLAAAGATLLNQAVLLKGVNDDAGALADLSEALFAAGVLPYYLHQLDAVRGAAHFQVNDAHARELHRQLRAMLPGYLVPRLVREVPGEPAKMPL
jgi:L-lysine 2,3-aminomutase